MLTGQNNNLFWIYPEVEGSLLHPISLMRCGHFCYMTMPNRCCECRYGADRGEYCRICKVTA